MIGAGVSGTLSAVHLVRGAGAGGVEVTLIDARGVFGPGVAYATADPLHLLNVPAARMGGIAGDPEHFHRWSQSRGGDGGPAAFLTRGKFGEYLGELLADAEADPASDVRRITAEAVAINPLGAPGGKLEIEFARDDDGRGARGIEVDEVVLAIGALPSGDPVAVPGALLGAGRYVGDPWATGALEEARRDRRVLILGTGQTMIDVALTLAGSEREPVIHAISRNGLTPRRHREQMTQIRPFPLPQESGLLDPIIAAVLEQLESAAEDGRDWRDVLDSMRAASPELWRALDVSEKRRFIADINRFWDVHRFRMAPAVADRFEELSSDGRIRVQAGSILALELAAAGVGVSWLDAGSGETRRGEFDRVINCTGVGALLAGPRPALIESLLASGAARADQLELGLDVDRDGALIGADGRPAPNIHVIGALRKGVEWETIGVTEFRDQAARVARLALARAR